MKQYKNLFYSVAFLCLFKPMMFNYWEFLDLFVNLLSVLLFLLLSLKLLRKWRYRTIHSITYLILFLHFIVFVSTILHHGNLRLCCNGLISSGSLAMFIEIYSGDLKKIIKTWFPLVELFLCINIISIFLGGKGSDDWLIDYFLGSKNLFQVVFASYFVIAYLYGFYFPKRRIHVNFCYVLMFAAVIITKSLTMLIELFIFIILLIYRKINLFRKFLEYRYLLIVFLCVFSLLIILVINANVDGILNVFEGTEKGSNTLNERIKIWGVGINIIIENPIMGVGKLTPDGWESNIGIIDFKTQLHNQIIEYLATGGIILLAVLLSIYILTAKRIHDYNRFTIAQVLSLVCFSLNVTNLTEAYYNGLFYFPFIISSYLSYILCDNKVLNKKSYENIRLHFT